MNQQPRGKNPVILWTMILIAIAYGIVIKLIPTLTGNSTLDGAIGVLLGLYICSHPAANVVDLIFFKRWAIMRSASNFAGFTWLFLNAAVFFAGWLVIVNGTLHLVVRSP